MRGDIGDRRLTWDPAYPTPFESIWSVLMKVVVLNNLTWPELTSLIKQRHLKGALQNNANPAAAATWIDFGRLAQLLGVDECRLTRGTWESMAMQPRYRNRYGLRRCPECWKTGYHCVLFDLIAIKSCPWHRCPLTEPCVMCASLRTFELRSHPYLASDRYCSGCRLQVPNRAAYQSMNRAGPDSGAMITDTLCRAYRVVALCGRKISRPRSTAF